MLLYDLGQLLDFLPKVQALGHAVSFLHSLLVRSGTGPTDTSSLLLGGELVGGSLGNISLSSMAPFGSLESA
jgi:hypothetical protein